MKNEREPKLREREREIYSIKRMTSVVSDWDNF